MEEPMATFMVMTWNIENLFRPKTTYGPATVAEYKDKLRRLSGVILHLDPDVLALQEIGSTAAFDDLLGLLEGRYPHTRLSQHPDARGIRVGFISKLSIEESEDLSVFPREGVASVPGIDDSGKAIGVTALSRGALRIRVRPASDRPIDLVTAHLKSKLLTYPSPPKHPRFSPRDELERARVAGFALLKRTAEAVALRI